MPETINSHDPRVARCRELLRKNPNMSIGKLALTAGLSPSRLDHLFKSESPISISKYRSFVRLLGAAMRLRSGSAQVKEVAIDAG